MRHLQSNQCSAFSFLYHDSFAGGECKAGSPRTKGCTTGVMINISEAACPPPFYNAHPPLAHTYLSHTRAAATFSCFFFSSYFNSTFILS